MTAMLRVSPLTFLILQSNNFAVQKGHKLRIQRKALFSCLRVAHRIWAGEAAKCRCTAFRKFGLLNCC